MNPLIRILVVDDDADVLRSTCRTLTQASYVATCASVGAEVLPALRAQPAHLVLLDRQLPDVDGLEICRQIKADPALAKVFVVITSGVHRGSEERIAGLEALADGYIERPISSRELLARVEAFVRIVRLTQSLAEQAEALRASEQEFRSLAEAMPQIFWACQPDGRNIYFNQQWVDYTGMTLEESYGHGWNKPFHPDDQQRAWEAWQNAVQHDATYSLECRLRRADGAYRWWLVRGVPQRDASGKVLKWFGTCTDIEEIKQAEQARRLSEDKFVKAFHGTPDAIIISRLSDGRLVEANEGFVRLSGYTREEVLSSSTLALNLWATPADRERCIALLQRDGKLSGLEFPFRNKAGVIMDCRYSAAIIQVNGEDHILSLVHDLTELHRSTNAVKASEALLRGILDNMQDAYVRTDREGRFIMVNPAAVRLYGYESEADMIGLSATVLYADPAEREAVLAEVQRSGSVADHVGRGRRKDGSTFWVSLSAHFYRDAAGNVLGSEGFMRDITERQQTEAKLQESEARYRSLFDNCHAVMLLIDPSSGAIVSANPAAAAYYGWTQEQLQGMCIDKINTLPPAEVAAEIQRALTQQCRRFEFRHRRADGQVCDVEVFSGPGPLQTGGRPLLFSIIHDIAARKQAEAALCEEEARLRRVIEVTEQGIWEWDIQTNREFFSRRWCEIVGYSFDDPAFAHTYASWAERIHPDDSERVHSALKDHLERGEKYDVDYRHRHKSGEYRWQNSKGKAVADESGKPVKMTGCITDITARKQAEAVLRESEATFRALVDSLPLAIYLSVGVDQVSEYVSPTMVKLFGYTHEDIPSVEQWWPLAYPDAAYRQQIAEEWTRRVERSLATHTPIEPMEVVVTCKDGTTKQVTWGYITLGNKNYAFGLDLTERKQAEAALRETNTYLENLMNCANAPIVVWDPHFHITRFNRAFEFLTGRRAAEVLGQSLEILFPPGLVESLMALIERTTGWGKRWESVEIPILHRDGTTRTVLWNSATLFAPDGQTPVAIIAQGQDITGRVAVEDRLRLLTTALEAAANGVVITDVAGTILWVNAAFTTLTGYDAAEAVGQNPRILKSGNYDPAFYRAMQAKISSGQVWHGELTNRRKDGSLYREEMTITPVRQGTGPITHFIAIKQDVTARQQAQKSLRASEARFRAVTDSATDAIISADSAGKIVGWNRGAERIFGYAEAEIRGQALTLLVPFRYQEWHLAGMARVQAGGERHVFGKTVEVAGCHRDGHEFPLELSLGEWEVAEGRFYTAIIRDISARRQAEEKLRELSIAVEQSPASIVITDPAGKIEYVNPKFLAVTGYTAAEVLGQNPRVLKSGETSAEAYRDLWQAITDGKEWRGEFHNRKKSGELFWESASISPIRDIAGRITRFVAVKEDITARKHAEAEHGQMEVQLRHAQKLESIGQLAAGIAHEINTPTQYIGDNTRFLQDSFKDIVQVLGHYDRLLQAARQQQVTPELVAATAAAAEAADVAYLAQEVPKSIEQTLQGVARVAKIVRAMKDFSHPGSVEKTPIDLNQAIESTITVAHNEWKYVADLDLALDPQLPLVPCLPGEINQVILNLVINAAHAIGDVVGDGASGKGRIRVSTRPEGDWAEVRVQDTGTGIPEAARARIFEPFFTTKAVGKGTGQGLSIAHLVVVKQHGGTIEFETELGRGTTFIVRLPLHPGPAAPERSPRTPEPRKPGDTTCL